MIKLDLWDVINAKGAPERQIRETLVPQYVYMLCTHDESGPDRSTATLDRAKIIDLLKAHYDPDADEISGLTELLMKPDQDLADRAPTYVRPRGGWGGVQLVVIALDAAPAS